MSAASRLAELRDEERELLRARCAECGHGVASHDVIRQDKRVCGAYSDAFLRNETRYAWCKCPGWEDSTLAAALPGVNDEPTQSH